VSVSVKVISIESVVSGLLFIGTDSTIWREGLWVEGEETQLSDIMGCETCGWDSDV